MRLHSKIFNGRNKKSTLEMFTDSVIIGVFAGLSILGNHIPTYEDMFVSLKAFGLAFVSQYIYEKKIKKLR